jgi:hypothetical protein
LGVAGVQIKVEYVDQTVNIICDKEGAAFLIQSLERIGTGGHDHLMTEDWAGWELSVGDVPAPGVLVHQLNLFVTGVGDPGATPA